MFTHNLNPVLLNIGPVEIRYYGLFAALSFVLGYFILKRFAKEGIIKMKKEQIENFLLYVGVGGVLGARLFYVLIYNLSYYLQNPFEIIAVWHGGLSAHGSFIGGAIGIYLFAKKYKYNLLELLDIIVTPLILGLAIGRLSNFINGELFGRLTNVSWCVDFGDGCRHPSQLYESLYSFVIFGTLLSIRKNKWKKGVKLSLFLVLYGTFRFFTEFFREPDLQLGYILGLSTGQLLSILTLVIGVSLFYSINKVIKK